MAKFTDKGTENYKDYKRTISKVLFLYEHVLNMNHSFAQGSF